MFIEIQQLKQSGFNKSQVARHLNLNWKTVDKYWGMDADGFAQTVDQAGNCQWPLENPHFWPRKVPTVPIPHLELTLVTLYRAC